MAKMPVRDMIIAHNTKWATERGLHAKVVAHVKEYIGISHAEMELMSKYFHALDVDTSEEDRDKALDEAFYAVIEHARNIRENREEVPEEADA